MAKTYTIITVTTNNPGSWDQDAFRLGGTLFHGIPWRRVLDPDGTKSDYFRIVNRETGRTVALAGFATERYHLGLRLTPFPSADIQTILMDPESSCPRLLRQLVALGFETAHNRKASWLRLVFNNSLSTDQICHRYLTAFSAPVGTMALDLAAHPPVHLWNTFFSKQGCQQKYILRFKKEGFTIREATTPEDHKTFYRYYDQNMRSIRAEPFPQNHFHRLQAELPPEDVRTTLLARGEETAGGLLTLLDHRRCIAYLRYVALNHDFPNHYHPLYALYWEAIEHTASLGFAAVDFGLTSNNENDPIFRLKKRFGCQFKPQPAVVIPAKPSAILSGTLRLLQKKIA